MHERSLGAAPIEREWMSGGTEPVFMIDEIDLLPDSVDPLLIAFRERYLPGAQKRGMELVHTLVTPPESPPDSEVTLLLFWKLAGVGGFWQMRSANASPEIAAWWRECDALCVRRKRRYAVEADSLASFVAAGRAHG
jgi:hypothetical protein